MDSRSMALKIVFLRSYDSRAAIVEVTIVWKIEIKIETMRMPTIMDSTRISSP